MKVKIIALLLIAASLTSMFASCKNKDNDEPNPEDDQMIPENNEENNMYYLCYRASSFSSPVLIRTTLSKV